MNSWIKDPLILENKTVRLVPLEEEHFDDLVEISKDERIWQFMPIDWLGKKNIHEMLLDALTYKQQGSQYPFVVIDKKTNKVFGSTRYLRINSEFRNLEIGWTWYSPSYWSSGYNKACKFLLLQHAFDTLQCISVNLGTAEENIRSRKAIEVIGGKLEGIVRNRLLSNGVKKNFAIYSIIDEEWPEVKKNLLTKLQ